MANRWQEVVIYRDPTQSRTLTCSVSETAYRFPTGAFSDSNITIPPSAGGNLVWATWQVDVLATTAQPVGSPQIGVELVKRAPKSDGTVELTSLAELTGLPAKAGPQHNELVVTGQLQQLFEETGSVGIGAPNGWRTVGHRIRADGVSAPLLYGSILSLLWAD